MNPPVDGNQGGFIRNVRSIFSKRADDNSKRTTGRVEKFLKSGHYPGLSTDVILESPCFQLREDGEVDRHVFLGITSKEFIMAIQHIRDYIKYPDILYRADVDLDLDGMELACSCPLNFVRFFLLDEGAHKFAVCTSLGSVWYFEMCNTSDGSDQLWTKWREMIREQDNPSSYGYRTWRVSKEDARDARKTAYNVEIKDELSFIRRPINFCSVDSIGVQYSVTNLNSRRYRTLRSLKRHSHQNKAVDLGENIHVLRELRVCNFFSEDTGVNPGPRRSCSVQNNTHDPVIRIEVKDISKPLTSPSQYNRPNARDRPRAIQNSSPIVVNHPEIAERQHQSKLSQHHFNSHQKTDVPNQPETARIPTNGVRKKPEVVRSRSECILGMSESLISSERGLHFKYSFLSFISEALPEEPHRAVDIVDIRFGRWGLKRTTLNQLHRIWKLRNVERLERELQSQLGLSDSDDSITDLFDEFSKSKQRRRPIERWQSALADVTRQVKPSLEQSLRKVAFPTCDVRQYKARRWMSGASPADFASQVTQIHIDLFLKVSELDVITFLDRYRRNQPSRVGHLLDFSRGISLLVVQEVLDSKDKTEQSRRLQFFLQASKVCFDSNDLHSTWTLVTGIRLLPVSLLREAWSSVINDHPAMFRDYVNICRVFTHLASQRYRDKLRSSAKQQAHLPWIPHFLWHVQHAMQRPMERTVKQEAKRSGLGVPKLFRRKASNLDVSSGLRRVISQHRGDDLSGGSWMTLHRDTISSSCLWDSEAADGEKLLSDCTDVDGYAHVLSSLIIEDVLSERYRASSFAREVSVNMEYLGNDALSRDVVSPDNRHVDGKASKLKQSHLAKSKQNMKVKEKKGKESKSPKDEKVPKSVNMTKRKHRIPVIIVSSPTSIADDSSVPQTREKRKKGCFSRKKARTENIRNVKVSKKKETKDKSRLSVKSGKGKLFSKRRASPEGPRSLPNSSAESESEQEHLVRTDVNKKGHVQDQTSEMFEDKQQGLPSKSIHSKPMADPSRRMSMFGNALEDEDMLLEKDSVIDKAVKTQLATARKGSTLEFILEGDDESTEEAPGTLEHKPSFLESIFGNKASSSNIAEGKNADIHSDHSKNLPTPVNTGRRQKKVQFVHSENTNQSHNHETKGVAARGVKQSKGIGNNATSPKARTDITSTVPENPKTSPKTLNGSTEALSLKISRKNVSFKNINSQSVAHNGRVGGKGQDRKSTHHSKLGSKSKGSVTQREKEDKNGSSFSNSDGTCCVVCERSGCVYDGCGLEKLLGLQLACLAYHLKSFNSLYSYITEKSMKLARQNQSF